VLSGSLPGMCNLPAQLAQGDGPFPVFLQNIGYHVYDIHSPWNMDSIN